MHHLYGRSNGLDGHTLWSSLLLRMPSPSSSRGRPKVLPCLQNTDRRSKTWAKANGKGILSPGYEAHDSEETRKTTNQGLNIVIFLCTHGRGGFLIIFGKHCRQHRNGVWGTGHGHILEGIHGILIDLCMAFSSDRLSEA